MTINIALDKMIMFTSDGASVMLGCNNGVQAKLKSIVPHLLEFHYVAHHEALSVSQAYQCVLTTLCGLKAPLEQSIHFFSLQCPSEVSIQYP